MPASWSITIVPGANPSDPATFNPPDLSADVGDVVHWNNTTAKPHLLWETDGSDVALPVPLGGTRWELNPARQPKSRMDGP